MNAQQAVLTRLDALAQELNRAERVIASDSLVAALRDRAGPKFRALIGRRREELRKLQEAVRRESAPTEWWERLAMLQKDCETVFAECGAFLQGVVVRGRGLDGGLCDMADALVLDLNRRVQANWWGLTIPAEREFVADMAQIIRLRFMDVSLWNLPVVAHEFGHVVALDLKVREPNSPERKTLKEVLARNAPGQERILHEYFADLFAVYSVGPAYACACVTRFNPAAGEADGPTHPSDARRIHFQLAALTQAARDAATGWKPLVDQLRALWSASRAAAGQPAELSPAARAEVDDVRAQLSELLRFVGVDVAYRGWLRAEGLAIELRKDDEGPPASRPEDTPADVLNAAWSARLNPWIDNAFELRRVAERAAATYRQAMRPRS